MDRENAPGVQPGFLLLKYRTILKGFLQNKLFVILVLLTAVLGYGFTLTNFSYGVDDTAFDTYYNGTTLLATGRFTSYILHQFFGIYDFVPFWQDFLAVIVLLCAVLFWCALIKRVAGDTVSIAAYIAFASIFISFPNINESFIHMMLGFTVGLGFLLTGISLAVSYEVLYENLNWKWLALPAFLMCLSVALYESFAPVYLCGMCMIIMLRAYYGNNGRETVKSTTPVVLKFCGILLAGIAARYAITALILFFGHIRPSTYNNIQIVWGSGQGILEQIQLVIAQILSVYIVRAPNYSYTLIFSISCVFLVFLGAILSTRKKNHLPFVMAFGLIVSSFLLTVLQGTITPMRASQSLMLIVAFTVWLLCALTKKWRKPLVLFGAACLVLIQTKDLSQWFYLDYMRYQQDKAAVVSIGTEIEKLDGGKPVVFIGTPPPYYENQKHGQSNGVSILFWGVDAFGTDDELIKFFRIHGFMITQSTAEQKSRAQEIAKGMTAWPKEGSIKECEDFIIVNFGNAEGY